MNKRKMMIKLVTILTIACMVSMIALTSFAAINPGDIKGKDNVSGTDQVKSLGQSLVGIIQTAGVVVAVVVMLVLGIKYMMGSAEEKAEYKKSMIPYLVGAIILFAASTITNVVYQFAIGI